MLREFDAGNPTGVQLLRWLVEVEALAPQFRGDLAAALATRRAALEALLDGCAGFEVGAGVLAVLQQVAGDGAQVLAAVAAVKQLVRTRSWVAFHLLRQQRQLSHRALDGLVADARVFDVAFSPGPARRAVRRDGTKPFSVPRNLTTIDIVAAMQLFDTQYARFFFADFEAEGFYHPAATLAGGRLAAGPSLRALCLRNAAAPGAAAFVDRVKRLGVKVGLAVHDSSSNTLALKGLSKPAWLPGTVPAHAGMLSASFMVRRAFLASQMSGDPRWLGRLAGAATAPELERRALLKAVFEVHDGLLGYQHDVDPAHLASHNRFSAARARAAAEGALPQLLELAGRPAQFEPWLRAYNASLEANMDVFCKPAAAVGAPFRPAYHVLFLPKPAASSEPDEFELLVGPPACMNQALAGDVRDVVVVAVDALHSRIAVFDPNPIAEEASCVLAITALLTMGVRFRRRAYLGRASLPFSGTTFHRPAPQTSAARTMRENHRVATAVVREYMEAPRVIHGSRRPALDGDDLAVLCLPVESGRGRGRGRGRADGAADDGQEGGAEPPGPRLEAVRFSSTSLLPAISVWYATHFIERSQGGPAWSDADSRLPANFISDVMSAGGNFGDMSAQADAASAQTVGWCERLASAFFRAPDAPARAQPKAAAEERPRREPEPGPPPQRQPRWGAPVQASPEQNMPY